MTRHAPVVCSSADAVGRLAAEVIANRLASRPALRMLLPTGHTPRGMYAALRERAGRDPELTAGATVLQLDEYAGLGPGDERSFAATLRRELEGVALAALHTLDGAAGDLQAEAARHAARLEAPVDLAVLGLGRNGHVAFDEPGSDLAAGVRVMRLAATTREDAASELVPVPELGLTTGLGTLLACRELLLLVTGPGKAGILRDVLTGVPSPERPASLLRAHPRLTVVCDPEAASALAPAAGRGSDHAVIVLGHREPGVSAEHRISRESLERIQRAERLVRRDPARAVVLTGYSSTGGLSEAEQMAVAWRDPDVPFLLEVAGTDTARNATRSLPLVGALGGIDRVTVVTSFWHLRAAYFFAPYADHGIDVRVRHEWRGLGWPRLLASELVKLPRAPRERRRAWAQARSSGPPA
jgi:glucosamine-6-phosphate deaminase